MKLTTKNNVPKIIIGLAALFVLSLLGLVGLPWMAHAVVEGSDPAMQAAEGEAASEDVCCKAGDATPPGELVKLVALGGLHSPYPDYAKLAKDDPDLVKQFRLPGCNECHGGGGGGGFCPALSQGVWFWGNTDDVLFRLVTLGSAELEKQGFVRYQWGSVHGPMPPMAVSIKSSDQLWKIIAFIRSINPPGTNPPEKVIPGKMAGEHKPH